MGGHCIPIDPGYLAHRVKDVLGQDFRFVQLAQEINAGMPSYVVRRAQDMLNERSLAVKGAKVAVLGVTYKPDVSDQRESPSREVARILLGLGAELTYVDPFVATWQVSGRPVPRTDSLESALADSDIVLMLQPHSAFSRRAIEESATPVLDTSGRFTGPSIQTL